MEKKTKKKQCCRRSFSSLCQKPSGYVCPALVIHVFTSSRQPLDQILCLQGDSAPPGDDGPFADTVTLEQKTSSIGGSSGKVSLWMQWMLPKVTVQLFAPEPTVKKTGTVLLKRLFRSFFFRSKECCHIYCVEVGLVGESSICGK